MCGAVSFVSAYLFVLNKVGHSRKSIKNGGQHGHGAAHSDREQAAGCLHTNGRSYAVGLAADRCSGWTECWQEFSAGKLCRQVNTSHHVELTS